MIRVEDLWVRVGAFGFEGLSFAVPTGSYAVLMGKTGCGKTTLLEAVCGLKAVAAGRIELLGRDVTALRPAELRDLRHRGQEVHHCPVRDHSPLGRAGRAGGVDHVHRPLGEVPLW